MPVQKELHFVVKSRVDEHFAFGLITDEGWENVHKDCNFS
jgi:hypothetical protein